MGSKLIGAPGSRAKTTQDALMKGKDLIVIVQKITLGHCVTSKTGCARMLTNAKMGANAWNGGYTQHALASQDTQVHYYIF